jgi:hypothetical protein
MRERATYETVAVESEQRHGVGGHRLTAMEAAVRRAGVAEEDVTDVAVRLVKAGVPLLQARFVLAGDPDPAGAFLYSSDLRSRDDQGHADR